MERNTDLLLETSFILAFFLNCDSIFFGQLLADATIREVTAISTPLDSVPLYTVPIEEEPITLLKSSQAALSSALLSFGTPMI